MPGPAPTVCVGSDYKTCPCCVASYLTDEPHHAACPLLLHPGRMCPYCGADTDNHRHQIGCPHLTGLFPVLHDDIGLSCVSCDTKFTLGSCYMDRGGMTCVSCVCRQEMLP